MSSNLKDQIINDLENKKQPQKKRTELDKRRRQLKRYSFWTVCIAIAIAIAFNLVLEQILQNRDHFDWTANQSMSLSEASKALLSGIEDTIEILPLADEKDFPGVQGLDFLKDLLNTYVRSGNGKVELRYLDLERDPSLVKELDPKQVEKLQRGSLIIRNPKEKKIKVLQPLQFIDRRMDQQTYQSYVTGYSAEAQISSAIQYVASKEHAVVYFTGAHQEDPREEQYRFMTQFLDYNNFETKDLESLSLDAIPEDCKLLVMLNPKVDIRVDEVEPLKKYIASGGNLLVFVDYSDEEFKNLNSVLELENIVITTNRIRENKAGLQLQNNPYTFFASEDKSPIQPERIQSGTLLGQARAIQEGLNAKDWLQVSRILESSDQGSLEPGAKADPDAARAVQSIALIAEDQGHVGGDNGHGAKIENSSKIAVIGSSLMVSDQVLTVFGNQTHNLQFLYQLLSWLVPASESKIAIPSNLPVSYVVRSEAFPYIPGIAVGLFVVLPLLFLIAAIAVYRRRKYL
ncbi:MAG: GldG family protein [Eubacteriales bacterium]|nr:GldG family protein [Eubacteriales bacterium]